MLCFYLRCVSLQIYGMQHGAERTDKMETYIMHYTSPLGEMLAAADGQGLTGLWFTAQKYFAAKLGEDVEEKETPVLRKTRRWLDVYFRGEEPDFQPDIHFTGTVFQLMVWEILRDIPYGQTTTYGRIAQQIAEITGKKTAGQAVGGAVGHNPISIIVPCHRVVGTDGNLTGYAGGLDKKIKLLTLEGVDMQSFYMPKKSQKKS